MRVLLVAAGLGVGASSAWADAGDVVYTNDFSTNDQTDFATWTAQGKKPSGYSYAQIGRAGSFSIATGALVHTATNGKDGSAVNNADVGVFKDAIKTATASTNYVLSFDVTLSILEHQACTSIFEISDESKQVLICLYATHTRSNSTSGSTSYGYIVGGNNGFQTCEASVTKSTNAEGYMGDGTRHEIANVSETNGSKTYHVVFDAQVAGKAKLTITEGGDTVVPETEYDISVGKGLKYIYFSDKNKRVSDGSITQYTSSALDNLSIVEGAASTNTADYTVKYVATIDDEETEIKESVVRNGFIDETVVLEASDKNAIVYSGIKYLYSTDNTSTTPVNRDGSTVIKVQFTQAPSYTYTVTDNLGVELARGSAFSGDNVYYYIPAYRFVGGRFYQNPSPNVGTYSQGQGTIPAIAANTDVTVTYTEEENTNVVFYSEAENLTGANAYSDDYTKGRMSNGSVGYYSTSAVFTTLTPGRYTLTSATRSGTTTFYKGEVGSGTQIHSITSSGAVTTTTSEEFDIPTTMGIYTSTGSSSKNYFDYVIIRRTGDYTLPATVTSAGWATLYTPYALDFSSLSEDLSAYTATCSESTVTLTKVNNVPAGSGVVLKGAANTYNIPVIASSNTDKGHLLGSATEATAYNAYDGYTLYMLKKVGENVQFVPMTSGSLAAGKAFLKIASGSSSLARSMYVVFADETTGIQTMRGEGATVNGYYNLSGQRVSQPTSGLYIVNGKKVVIK